MCVCARAYIADFPEVKLFICAQSLFFPSLHLPTKHDVISLWHYSDILGISVCKLAVENPLKGCIANVSNKNLLHVSCQFFSPHLQVDALDHQHSLSFEEITFALLRVSCKMYTFGQLFKNINHCASKSQTEDFSLQLACRS